MNHLQDLKIAQNEYTEALMRLATAKHQLETSKAELIIGGLEGKNQAERDARLRDELEREHLEEHRANLKVIKTRGAYQNAKALMEFDNLRVPI